MKKLSKLKLTQLSKSELAARELNTLKGGYCICAVGQTCMCICMGDNEDHTGLYNPSYTYKESADHRNVMGY